ncbi:MAG: 2-oxoacid:acceptor oxidoreductase subunit alpha [Anaerolineaceae bacterium]|nr:MAG: 2-oxoacid:acceptor oxidoreductase subunit alpha [Anaerolineaceae bacterium]
MAESKASVREKTDTKKDKETIVNDFSMVVATVNGSGSQTSNLAIIRSLFRMGIPVSGKNLFPSNIQGLPTWFTIRVSSEGHTARRENNEILVAMNPTTFSEDLRDLGSEGVCFYDDRFKITEERPDVTFYPMPVRELVKEINPPTDLRDYIANMAYVGIVAEMLGIDMDEIRGALETHFMGKQSAVDLNMRTIQAASSSAEENLIKQDSYYLERSDQTHDLLLIDGNTASALGAIYGGVSFAAWYPITPASSLADALEQYLPQLRMDEETGKATYVVIQAEDELAAIGMAVGAGWAGARAMTSTSGPGISLMAEFAGLAFFAEIPIVVSDVQRMGPSTGLPTRTSQGDILFVRFLGHGDTNQVMLLPGSIAECFEFGWQAFDLAERLQTPIFVLSDLDLGMNLWMSEKFAYPSQSFDRGKILAAEDLDRIGKFSRYQDVDGDGITYRTLPGTDHPLAAYFTRGTGHDENAIYSEKPDDWEMNIERIWRKLETAREMLPRPVIQHTKDAHIGLIGYGSTDPAIQEALDRLNTKNISADYLRIRAVPFVHEIETFIREHDVVYVIEMNTDGQMYKLLQLEVPDQAEKLHSLTHNNGLPLSAHWVVEAVLDREGG